MAEYNFNNCVFDITKFGKDVSIQDSYPELISYPDVLELDEIEQKIGICLTDMGSPFISIKDHKYKVDSIISFLKNQYTDTDFSSEFWNLKKDMIQNYKPCDTMDMCAFMLEYQNHHDFNAWYRNNILYYSLSKRLDEPIKDGEDEDKYDNRMFSNQKRMEELGKKLKEQEAMLFGSEAMKLAALRSKKKRLSTYAEKYAVPNQVE